MLIKNSLPVLVSHIKCLFLNAERQGACAGLVGNVWRKNPCRKNHKINRSTSISIDDNVEEFLRFVWLAVLKTQWPHPFHHHSHAKRYD